METIDVYGRKPDGSTTLIGTAPITEDMKRRVIVSALFGEPSADPEDCTDADMCLLALEQYHEWLVNRGWTAPEWKITPKAAAPATENEE